MLFKKDTLKNVAILKGKHLCWSLKACSSIKKRLQHMWFPVTFAKILRKVFFMEHLRWLLLHSKANTLISTTSNYNKKDFRSNIYSHYFPMSQNMCWRFWHVSWSFLRKQFTAKDVNDFRKKVSSKISRNSFWHIVKWRDFCCCCFFLSQHGYMN